MKPSDGSDSPIQIEPLPFRADYRRPSSSFRLRWVMWVVLLLLFLVLSASAWYVFTARQVEVRIDPDPDRTSISGSILAPRLGTFYLLRPGEYTVRAYKVCYRPLEQPIKVTEEKGQSFSAVMEKLPGRLSLRVHQAERPEVDIEGAGVHIDGEEIGITPLRAVEVEPGRRHVEILAKNYQELETSVDIEGCGQSQSFDFALVPGWSDITIVSIPLGANIRLDGKLVGTTPSKLDLLPGTYKLEISAEGYKTWFTRLAVQANQPQMLDQIRLHLADGTLALRTKPPGAHVTVDDRYVGKTPLEIHLRPDTEHMVRISKAGYEKLARQVTVSSAGRKVLNVDLTPINGVVYLVIDPADGELLIDGKSWGKVQRELHLAAVEQHLEIRKKGYQSFHTKITPRPGFPQELKVSLTKEISKKALPPALIRTVNGYTLKLIRPGPFTMGASRREQGRRSNETLRKVALARPFYMGLKEVTNRDFRDFLTEHNSGSINRQSLNGDELPVVQVSWEQAALFCNWLSAKESLPASYVKRGDRLLAAEPMGTGYRLPTEAEWEYCARFKNNTASLKYPWGNSFPPTPSSGNFADLSAKDLLSNYLEMYNDGYPVTAPPGVFKPNDLGFYDLGGNVAEWCHDYYSIYPYSAQKLYRDPLGPTQGRHRVVRGSSWKDSSTSSLRVSYRDYSNSKRSDLGFRICRYLTDANAEN